MYYKLCVHICNNEYYEYQRSLLLQFLTFSICCFSLKHCIIFTRICSKGNKHAASTKHTGLQASFRWAQKSIPSCPVPSRSLRSLRSLLLRPRLISFPFSLEPVCRLGTALLHKHPSLELQWRIILAHGR